MTRRLAIVALLAIHAGLLSYAATKHGPTALEPASLAAGLSHWEFGRFELFPVNPPLVRLVSTLPAMLAGYKMDWSSTDDTRGPRPEFAYGVRFFKLNGDHAYLLLIFARWACIPFSIIGAITAYAWSKALYGNHAGYGVLLLWCFDPMILAHGSLVSTDCAATSLFLLANYRLWVMLRAPTVSTSMLAGGALGLALLSKSSAVLLLGLWPTLAGIAAWRCRNHVNQVWPILRSTAMSLPIGLLTLNSAYLFNGTCLPLSSHHFQSSGFTNVLAQLTTATGPAGLLTSQAPLPFPADYIKGIDLQKLDFEDFRSPGYLHGEWSHRGWWYYYLYGILVKETHGFHGLLVLSILSMTSMLSKRFRMSMGELVLLASPLVLLGLACHQTGINHHFRYALPSLGGLIVFCGRSMTCTPHSPASSGARVALAWVAIAAAASSTMSQYPALIEYFNELSGGPSFGHRHLLHSSYDWGQHDQLAEEIESRNPQFSNARHFLVGPIADRLSPETTVRSDVEIWSISRYLEEGKKGDLENDPSILMRWNTLIVVLRNPPNPTRPDNESEAPQ